MPEVKILTQTIEIDGLENVVVLDVEHDDDIGDYFREFRFFVVGDPQLLILSVRVRSSDAVKLKVGAPPFEF